MNEYESGDPVMYRNRHFTVVRYMPGFPRQVVIADDEGEEMRVREDAISPA